MSAARISCNVDFADESARFGVFANAFRVLPDAGGDVYLDFCVYSSEENRARVVSRIRVAGDFVPQVVERLRESLHEIGVVGGLSLHADVPAILPCSLDEV